MSKALKVSVAILNLIQASIGSQWSLLRVDELESHQLRNDTGSVPDNLWRQADLRGHGGATRCDIHTGTILRQGGGLTGCTRDAEAGKLFNGLDLKRPCLHFYEKSKKKGTEFSHKLHKIQ